MEQANRNANFSKLKIIKNLTVLSIAFLLLYTAYNGLTMLQSTMNKIQGIGTTGQAVLYISYGISSLLISSYAIKKLGIKVAQILGMVLYLPYIAANFYPAWITIIPSAVLLGIGSTLNWGAQCTYFNECAALYNKIVNKSRTLKSINFEQVYMSATPNNYASNVQMSENQPPYAEGAKQILNKEDKKSSSYSINTSPLHSKNTNNDTSESLDVNDSQSSKKIKKETSSVQGPGETFTRIKNDTNISKSLKNTPLDGKNDVPFSTLERDTQKKPKSLSSTNALFFGFHGMAYCSSQIWSNLICFSVLSYGITENFNKTLNCSCGAGFCDTDEECVDESIEEVPTDTRHFLTLLCVVCGAIGALSVWLFLDPMDKREEKVTFSFDEFLVTIRYIKKKEQLFMIPLTILGGMIQAFYTADVTKAYIACAWTLSQVGMVTVFYGVSSALSSLLSGVLIKYLGRIPVVFMCQILNVANLIFLLLWKPSSEASFTFYIEGAIFGFIVGVFHTQTKALYGTFFEGDEETAFSSCNMYSSIGWSLPFLYSLFICTSVKIYILLTLSCVGIVGSHDKEMR
ncbi:UNC93-like protein like [Argiope bruennichi]|uniref:UNC93-like protein like n=1 Tax=Argiope bruennichi TaxID=94029 RepID=A0A8T0FRJ4_ARGBR|nr:UNC93-like protein like [Argiope bruennichi]